MSGLKRLSIPLDEKQHQRIKLAALLENKSIKDYVLDRMFNDKVPNEATMRAMRDAEDGIGEHAKTVDEMFNDILSDEDK